MTFSFLRLSLSVGFSRDLARDSACGIVTIVEYVARFEKKIIVSESDDLYAYVGSAGDKDKAWYVAERRN